MQFCNASALVSLMLASRRFRQFAIAIRGLKSALPAGLFLADVGFAAKIRFSGKTVSPSNFNGVAAAHGTPTRNRYVGARVYKSNSGEAFSTDWFSWANAFNSPWWVVAMVSAFYRSVR
ncbi:MAG: hypothetical protein R3C41_11660 [Calditrichia bacterium]